MNLPLTSGRSLVYPFALESALTLALVYGLGKLTLALAPTIPGSFDFVLAVSAAAPLAASVSLARHTRRRFRGSLAQEVTLVSMLTVILAGAATILFFILKDQRDAGLATAIMLESAIIVPAAAFAWRWVAVHLRIPGFCSERVVILGTGRLAQQLCDYISDNHGRDFDVVGFVSTGAPGENAIVRRSAPLLDPEALARVTPRQADRIIVALAEKRGTLPVRELIDIRLKGIPVEESTSFIERCSGKIHVQSLLPSWLIFSDGFRISPIRAAMKRSGDFTLAAILLSITAPLMLITALAIRLDSKGSVFYRQKRVGLDGKEFWIIKFRSMIENAEESGPTWATEDDARNTRVGRILRKLRIDELPQVWNVLKGEMSFVGPRPERPHFVNQLQQEIPFYALRSSVRPGITGWAQVKYRYGSSADDALEKLKYDVFYIKNASFLLDMWIVVKTIRVVLLASGSR